jgi:hypothetical protein
MSFYIAIQALGTVGLISLAGGALGGVGAFVLCRLRDVNQHHGVRGWSEENICVACSGFTGFFIGIGLGVSKVASK